MNDTTCVTHLRTILDRLVAQREAVMLSRTISRREQTAELDRLLEETKAVSYAIGRLDPLALATNRT